MAGCTRPALIAGWSLALEAGCDIRVGLCHAEARPLGPRENIDPRTLRAHQRSCPAGLDLPRDLLRPTMAFALRTKRRGGSFAGESEPTGRGRAQKIPRRRPRPPLPLPYKQARTVREEGQFSLISYFPFFFLRPCASFLSPAPRLLRIHAPRRRSAAPSLGRWRRN